MRKLDNSPIWLGNAADLRDTRRLHEHGIRALVDLAADEPVASPTRDLVYLRFPLVDGAGSERAILSTCLVAVSTLIRAQVPTLVACSAGLSRTPAVVAGSLAIARGREPLDALRDLSEHTPCDVSPSLWAEIERTAVGLRDAATHRRDAEEP